MSYENTEETLKRFPEFIKTGWALGKNISVLDKISSIVVCGMGGSAIPGDLLAAYVNSKTPVYTLRNYALPNYIDHNALVFVSSYSGNTEETISMFRAAMGRGCKIIGISSGGKLKGLCEANKLPYIELPAGIQPRAAVPLLFFPILRVLHNSRLIPDQEQFVSKTIDAVSKKVFSELGASLAEKLKGRLPVIYASENFKAVAYRWKTQINENSKTMAFSNAFPELNHNEIVGYTHLEEEFYVVMIQDDGDSARIRKRMQITKSLIREKGVSSTVVSIKGACLLSRLFSALHIGDWVSLKLAGLYDIDPEPVEIIENLKKGLR